jgi:hypothetical protein
MAVANLANEPQEVITGNDNIVIVDNFQSVRGGRTLDTTEFTPEVINAGHVIIKETATGEYKPMPVTEDGAIGSIGSITAGSGYTQSTYNGVALIGGSGSGATANIIDSTKTAGLDIKYFKIEFYPSTEQPAGPGPEPEKEPTAANVNNEPKPANKKPPDKGAIKSIEGFIINSTSEEKGITET